MADLQPSNAAKQAFGIRLRDLRLGANLSGRQLAALTGLHVSKISRAEHAHQKITEAEVRAWATACGQQDQIPELVAAHREVEQTWLEYRSALRVGMKNIQLQSADLFERTKLTRIYESLFIPGFLQTLGYAKAQFAIHAKLHGLPVADVDEAAQNRLTRQRFLGRPQNTFSFLLEATALHNALGGVEVMNEQLDFLEHVATLPNVAVGIIPLAVPRTLYPGEGFYLFDEKLLRQEYWSGAFRTTRAEDITFFVRTFAMLREQALYGAGAREQIEDARRRLQSSATS